MNNFHHPFYFALFGVPVIAVAVIFLILVNTVEPKRQETETYEFGDSFVTYVNSSSIGEVAVQVSLPEASRFEEGVPVVLPISTYFTEQKNFDDTLEPLLKYGVATISYLYPGIETRDGVKSDGEFDYGGANSIAALRDVIQFASGDQTNSDGLYLHELIGQNVLYEHTGLYAFSHPGMAMICRELAISSDVKIRRMINLVLWS